MNLKQLQVERRKDKGDGCPCCYSASEAFANALTPHIQQQEADMALLKELLEEYSDSVIDEGYKPEKQDIYEKVNARLAEYEGEKG
jgi:hypothetical protein